jgi:hypothetical protein
MACHGLSAGRVLDALLGKAVFGGLLVRSLLVAGALSIGRTLLHEAVQRGPRKFFGVGLGFAPWCRRMPRMKAHQLKQLVS